MPLEVASFLNDLTETWPTGTDFKTQGDDHFRLLKTVLKTTFPNATKGFLFPTALLISAAQILTSAAQNCLVVCDAASAAFQVTLPNLVVGDAGWSIDVVKTDATANAITVAPSAGTINGAASVTIVDRWDIVRVVWTGSTWIMRKITIPGVVEATAAQYRALQAGSLTITPTTVKNAQAYVGLGNISGAVNIDLTQGINFNATLVGNTTITFQNEAVVRGRGGFIQLAQDGTGGRSIDFAVQGGNIRYPDQSKPSQTQTANRWNAWGYHVFSGNILMQLTHRGWA